VCHAVRGKCVPRWLPLEGLMSGVIDPKRVPYMLEQEARETQFVLVSGEVMAACVDISQTGRVGELVRALAVVKNLPSVSAELDWPIHWIMFPFVCSGEINHASTLARTSGLFEIYDNRETIKESLSDSFGGSANVQVSDRSTRLTRPAIPAERIACGMAPGCCDAPAHPPTFLMVYP
jgi:hypothetical protein